MVQKLNVQYSSRELLNNVFKCKTCNSPLLMFGCANEKCKNSNSNNMKKWENNSKEHKENGNLKP